MTQARTKKSKSTATMTEAERAFADRFFAQVDKDDKRQLTPEQVATIAREQLRLSARKRGQTKIAFLTNEKKGQAWRARCTFLHVVSDDFAFLIDSIAAYLADKRAIIDMLLHPRLSVHYGAQGQVTLDPRGEGRQSNIYIVIRGILNAAQQKEMTAGLQSVIDDVRDATGDWQTMRLRALEAKQYLGKAPTDRFARDELVEYSEFLDYLYDNNFTFLGARTYHFTARGNKVESSVVKGSGLGLLRDERFPAYISETGAPLPPPYQKLRRDMPPLYISKVNRISTVHRRVPLDAVAVHHYDDDGQVVGETLFIGLFTSVTYSRSLRSIPILKYRAEAVIKASGYEPASHDGRALRHILEKYPRDELFQTTVSGLQKTCASILRLQERQRIALYCRADLFGRYVSCLVYVPRDRFETRLRLRFQQILEQELGGTCTNFYSTVDDSPLVRILFTINIKQQKPKSFHPEKIELLLQEAGRVWGDALADVLHHNITDDAYAERLIDGYANAFSPDYRDRYRMETAVQDIHKIESALSRGALEVDVQPGEAPDQLTLKIYSLDRTLVLSDILPILENMGLRVMTEHSFEVQPKSTKREVIVQDIALQLLSPIDLPALKDHFEQAFLGIFNGAFENDRLNALTLQAGLTARAVTIVRTYVRYLRQAGLPFSLPYLEQAVTAYPALAADLVSWFTARFDPHLKNRGLDKKSAVINKGLEKIVSLDHDRIWRALWGALQHTVRTNFYQTLPNGDPKPYLSVKLDSRQLSFLPDPKPFREIFVYSTRMEGVHLRNGRIARGGIRWSDRAEDFRTEILGLMKAQTVKNAVIVPSGAKGGFILKCPPKSTDRAALQAEGIACYQYLVRGLLDITDNIDRRDKVVKPRDVVVYDGDDPYLVVAADKGTATFSDIANKLSIEYGFWTGDAFASGGSAGYDHKEMGITARGAWESVKRHFREMGHDTQSQEFDVIGVGDMGGDVFGNGMLLSPHIRLVGAFNHMHIFCDPAPDAGKSFGERRRLFKGVLGWDHYDPKCLSKGGRIYNRSDKVLELTPEIQKRFDLSKNKVTPPELMTAILKARADLMYLGGIGTYVKASTETHTDVGDRSNEAQRINAAELRARVVAEGANLGFTQRARIEAARIGVRLNADFIDNSAGVDTSDHEVNIKILLSGVIARRPGTMTRPARDKILHSMTDEVAALVLQDNYQQTQAISLLSRRAPELLASHQLFMQDLERAGTLDRALEFLPNDEMIARRQAEGAGLTRPELGILLSYAKLQLREELLASSVPDQVELNTWLVGYFPAALQKKFAADIVRHPLRREIIATLVSNILINRLGPTAVRTAMHDYDVSAAAVARAFIMATKMLDMRAAWQATESLDGKIDAGQQLAAFAELAILVERLTGWLLVRHGDRLDITQGLKAWDQPMGTLVALLNNDKGLKQTLTPAQQQTWRARYDDWIKHHVPADLAHKLAGRSKLGQAPAILTLSLDLKKPIAAVARVYFELAERFAFSWLSREANGLPRPDRWADAAMQTVEARLDMVQVALARQVLMGASRAGGDGPVGVWTAAHQSAVAEVTTMINDMKRTGLKDLAMALVIIQKMERLLLG